MNDNWSDYIIEDFVAVAEQLGIDVEPNRRHDNGIFWEAYPWQAAFQGTWKWDDLCWMNIRDLCPKDEELHRIADALWAAGKAAKPFYTDDEDPAVKITVNHHGPGLGWMSFEVYDADTVMWDNTDESINRTAAALNTLEEAIKDACKDLCRWLARSLEDEYDLAEAA